MVGLDRKQRSNFLRRHVGLPDGLEGRSALTKQSWTGHNGAVVDGLHLHQTSNSVAVAGHAPMMLFVVDDDSLVSPMYFKLYGALWWIFDSRFLYLSFVLIFPSQISYL